MKSRQASCSLLFRWMHDQDKSMCSYVFVTCAGRYWFMCIGLCVCNGCSPYTISIDDILILSVPVVCRLSQYAVEANDRFGDVQSGEVIKSPQGTLATLLRYENTSDALRANNAAEIFANFGGKHFRPQLLGDGNVHEHLSKLAGVSILEEEQAVGGDELLWQPEEQKEDENSSSWRSVNCNANVDFFSVHAMSSYVLTLILDRNVDLQISVGGAKPSIVPKLNLGKPLTGGGRRAQTARARTSRHDHAALSERLKGQ